jgi:alpha-galactosidase
MKIVFLGAGSHFFESVLQEISQTKSLHGSEILLYDINPERVEIIHALGGRISDHFKAGLRLRVASELAEALDGADVAVSSIGVHGPGFAWHRLDVEAVAKFGIMQTTGDTVGPSGISQGLRIIPIYLEIAAEMEKRCPECVLLNHSNPMGAICRAVGKYSKIKCVGYCHNVAGAMLTFSQMLEVPATELDFTVAGINHMVWLLSLRHRGSDVYPLLKERILEREMPHGRHFTKELLEITDLYMIGGDRHIIEFFPHARVADSVETIPYGLKWRSHMIAEGKLTEELTKEASEIRARAAGDSPLLLPELQSPEAMGRQIEALKFGPDMLHVVNTRNDGAVSNLPPWAVVELKAVVGMHGASSVSVGEMPPQAARWTLAQIYANELIIDAAAEGSRRKALQALASDPMIRDFREAGEVLDALVVAQQGRLDPFRKAER